MWPEIQLHYHSQIVVFDLYEGREESLEALKPNSVTGHGKYL